METLLGFFSDLILFTAGLVVATFWLFIIGGVAIEIYDLVTGDKRKNTPETKNEVDF